MEPKRKKKTVSDILMTTFISLLVLIIMFFWAFPLWLVEHSPRPVCDANSECPLTVTLNNAPEGYPKKVVLNFSERTLPAKDGSWIDRTLRNSSKPKVNVASNDPYVSRVYLSLYQEALRNGLNPELAKAAKKQEEEEEYEHMKVSHAVHYSFAKEDGSVVKLDGYCNDDKESKGTYMNGVQICGVSTIFGREFIQNNLKL